ncbi:GDSL esterase/lipase At5g45670 [Linum grandiflorum]
MIANQLDNLMFTDRSFIDRAVSEYVTYVQSLYATGARKFGFISPLQIGCSPVARSRSPTRRCNARANSIAAAIPPRMEVAMSLLQDTNPDIMYSIGDTYSINADITNSPTLYGKCRRPGSEYKECYGCMLWERNDTVCPEFYRMWGSRRVLVLGSDSTIPKRLKIGYRSFFQRKFKIHRSYKLHRTD